MYILGYVSYYHYGSGGHLLVISFVSVFISFIGSGIRLDWEESGSVIFRVISGHLLVVSVVPVAKIRKL